MPRVVLASSLARWCEAEPTSPSTEQSLTAPGATVREVLDNVFARFPMLRSYVLDERQALRPHVMIVVGNQVMHDKERLSAAVPEGADVYVIQALSGG